MTTPAISKRDITYLPNSLSYGTTVVSTSGVASYVEWQERPASISSPIRSDKTRAPTSWSNTWWRHHVVSGRLTSNDGWAQEPYPLAARAEPDLPGWPDWMDSRLWISAATRAKNQHVNLGVTLAEAGKAAEQIGDTSRDFAAGLNKLRSSLGPKGLKELMKGLKALKDSKNRVAVGNYAVDQYLGYCYGWQPTVNDIAGIMKSIYDLSNRGQTPQFSVSARASDSVDYFRERTNGALKETIDAVATLDGYIKLVFSSFQPDVAFAAQMGAYNPLSTAYELIPYSFVLDWIVPIGDWLNSLDGFAGKRFKEGSLSRKIALDTQTSGSSDDRAFWRNYREIRPGRLVGGQFVRIALTELPVLIPPPSIRNPLSLDHVAKGTALAVQALQGWERSTKSLRL